MQAAIKAKAGAAALTRVQQYLTQTGDPHPEVYTKLAADAAFLYRYDLSVQDWRFAEVNPGARVPELVDQKEIDNSSAATVTEQFSYTKTTTDTFAFSFTEGLKVGWSAKFQGRDSGRRHRMDGQRGAELLGHPNPDANHRQHLVEHGHRERPGAHQGPGRRVRQCRQPAVHVFGQRRRG